MICSLGLRCCSEGFAPFESWFHVGVCLQGILKAAHLTTWTLCRINGPRKWATEIQQFAISELKVLDGTKRKVSTSHPGREGCPKKEGPVSCNPMPPLPSTLPCSFSAFRQQKLGALKQVHGLLWIAEAWFLSLFFSFPKTSEWNQIQGCFPKGDLQEPGPNTSPRFLLVSTTCFPHVARRAPLLVPDSVGDFLLPTQDWAPC